MAHIIVAGMALMLVCAGACSSVASSLSDQWLKRELAGRREALRWRAAARGVQGKAVAMETVMRRTDTVTLAAIFRSFSRIVPQVAVWKVVWRSASLRSALSRT